MPLFGKHKIEPEEPQKEEVIPDEVCPLLRRKCVKKKCQWWVSMDTRYIDQKTGEETTKQEASCAVAWIPLIQAQSRSHITEAIKGLKNG